MHQAHIADIEASPKEALASVDPADIEIFTRTTTFAIMQSLRLDRGPSGRVHP